MTVLVDCTIFHDPILNPSTQQSICPAWMEGPQVLVERRSVLDCCWPARVCEYMYIYLFHIAMAQWPHDEVDPGFFD